MNLLTLKEALGLSRNIPALKAFQSVDNKQIFNFVTSLGMKPEVENGAIHEAHAIGAYNGTNPVEMAAAYSAFANGGYFIKPYTITKVIYSDSGEEDVFAPIKNKVMKESTAYIMTNVLKWAVDGGLSRSSGYVPGYETAVKTGTSNFDDDFIRKWKLSWSANNDLWSVGYSPEYSLAVWYGYDTINADSAKNNWYNASADGTRKNTLFNMIFKEMIKDGEKKFKAPKNVVAVTIEKNSIPPQLPSQYTPANMRVTEYFSKGTEPTSVSLRYERLANPKDIEVKITGNKVNISWKPAPTPLYYTDDYMLEHFETYYGKNYAEYLELHKSGITTELGVLGHDIYYRGADNVEKFIVTTTENSIVIDKPKENGTITLLVKTAFSVFKPNSSPGLSYTYKNEIIDPKVKYDKTVTKSIGSPELKITDLLVIENEGVDITNDCSISYVMSRSPGGIPSEFPIKTNAPATYNVEYVITYKGIDIKTPEKTNIKQTIEIK